MSTIGDFYGIFKGVPNLGGEFSIHKNAASTPSFEDKTSFLFDGIDDKIESVSSFTSIDGEEYVGISLWIKIPDVSLANEPIIRINNSVSGFSFYMFVRATGAIDISFPSGSSFTRTNTGAITDNTWHQVFVRFDGSISSRYQRLRVFVDGVLNHASSNFSNITTFPNNSSTMFIAHNSATAYANVYVNELAFYTNGNDTLPIEIYNNGVGNNLNTDNSFAPLIWYRSENAIWNGTQWRVTDENANGVDLLSFNMVEASRVEDVPT